ncbi:hypothetical protein HUU05_11005 [candidate division KSB1 bacterium]|nr:hypothetical protein [candidate division KSB1 bacterium]
MLKYTRTTATQTGLEVCARLNRKQYRTRRKIDDAQMAQINIRRHKVLPEWNYTIYPTGCVRNSNSPFAQK